MIFGDFLILKKKKKKEKRRRKMKKNIKDNIFGDIRIPFDQEKKEDYYEPERVIFGIMIIYGL